MDMEVVVDDDESPHAIVVLCVSNMLFKMNSFLDTFNAVNRFLEAPGLKDERMADLLRTRLDQERVSLLTLGEMGEIDIWGSLERAFEELDELQPLYQQLLSLSKAAYAAQSKVQIALASLAASNAIS